MDWDPTSSFWRAAVAFSALAAFFIWESLEPYRGYRNRRLHATRNLTIAGFNAVLVGLCCAGATAAVAQWTETRQLGLLHGLRLSPAWTLVFAFVALDLWTYWWHRANHRVPLLWRFHRMHHSDPDMDVSTAMRFHGGELLMSALLRLALFPLLGLSLTAVALYSTAVLVATEFHHANIGFRDGLDRAIRLFVVSPNMHKVHHSRDRFETDSNYSTLFSAWDRIFGTYRTRADYHSIRYGLEELDADRFQSIRGLVLTPLRSQPGFPPEA